MNGYQKWRHLGESLKAGPRWLARKIQTREILFLGGTGSTWYGVSLWNAPLAFVVAGLMLYLPAVFGVRDGISQRSDGQRPGDDGVSSG